MSAEPPHRDKLPTLEGVPPPPAPPTLLLHELLTQAVQDAVAEQLTPVRKTWDARSQDMLDVLADSAEARAHVKRAAGTIHLAGWIGVLAMVLGGLAVWGVLERDRVERRAHRELDRSGRDAALARIERVCGRR